MESRSSALKKYRFWRFSAIITINSSKREEARSIILRWPKVGGSKEPGNTALNMGPA
jgi:hypothetical protein